MGTIEIVLIKYFMQFFRMVTNELAPPSSPVAVVAAKSTLISLVSGSTERERRDGGGKGGKAQIFSQFSTAFSGKNISTTHPLPSSPSRSQREGDSVLIHSISDSPPFSCRYCIADPAQTQRASSMGSALT